MNKMIKKSLILSLFAGFGFALPVMAMEEPKGPYHELAKNISQKELVARYSVSPELKSVIDINLAPYICGKTLDINTVEEFSWLPGYMVKEEKARVIGSILIRQSAEKYGCKLVTAPIALFYMSQAGIPLSIESKTRISSNPFSLKQIKQIYKVSKVTDYRDIKPANILNTQEGIAVFVDTERDAFVNVPPFSKLNYLGPLQSFSLTPEARKWLDKKIAKYKKREFKEALVMMKAKGKRHE